MGVQAQSSPRLGRRFTGQRRPAQRQTNGLRTGQMFVAIGGEHIAGKPLGPSAGNAGHRIEIHQRCGHARLMHRVQGGRGDEPAGADHRHGLGALDELAHLLHALAIHFDALPECGGMFTERPRGQGGVRRRRTAENVRIHPSLGHQKMPTHRLPGMSPRLIAQASSTARLGKICPPVPPPAKRMVRGVFAMIAALE